MKNLKDYYNDIYKCSKCGLCQGVCPIFKITKNEAALSRGKFLMLLSYLEGKIPLSKTLKKYLDMCTFCGACTNFCPSDCDANTIFNMAKLEYNNKKFNFILKFLFKIHKIIAKLFKTKTKKYPNNINVVYFEGCATKCLFNKTKKATLSLLEKMKVNVIQPDFECCGIVAQNLGDKNLFEEQFKKNINILKNLKYDYIIFDCASCLNVVKNYDKFFEIEDFEQISQKCISILEFLQIKNIKFQSVKRQKITYHKPCHLDFDVEDILKNIENVDYIQMGDFDKCCGFSGEFAITNSKIAKEMFKDKAKNIEKTLSDKVLTFCPSCILGLKMATKYTSKKHKIINVVEFLDNLKITA